MRAQDDYVAARKQKANEILQAKRRAVAECRGRCTPRTIIVDGSVPQPAELRLPGAWDRLSVDYLLEPWPPSKLN